MENTLIANTLSYHGHSLERALRGIAGCGIRNVELAAIPGWSEHAVPERMSRSEVRALGKSAASHGLEIASVSGHLEMTADGVVEPFKRRIDFTAELGARWIITSPGEKAHIERFRKNMEILGAYAEKAGVVICLETENGIIYDAESVRAVKDLFRSPFIRINYDGANLIYHSNRTRIPHEDVGAVLEYVDYMHVKDVQYEKNTWFFPEVGRGLMDYDAFCGVLKERGYRGPLSIELELTDQKVGDGELGHHLPVPPAEEVDAILRRSADFIRKKMG
jgi:sugar phosphate isomerase/epimerase